MKRENSLLPQMECSAKIQRRAHAPDAWPVQLRWSLHWRRPASSSSFYPSLCSVSLRSSLPGSSSPLRGVATGDGRQGGKSPRSGDERTGLQGRSMHFLHY